MNPIIVELSTNILYDSCKFNYFIDKTSTTKTIQKFDTEEYIK